MTRTELRSRRSGARRRAVLPRVVLALSAVAALAMPAAAAPDGQVAIGRAWVEPALISPSDANEVADFAVVHARVDARAVAGLRGVERRSARAARADERSFSVAWTARFLDGAGGEAASVEGRAPLGGAVDRRAHALVEAPWDGRAEDGAVVPDGDYDVHLTVVALRSDTLGNGDVRTMRLGETTAFVGTVTVDNTAPSITIGNVPACSRGPVTPSISVEDAHAVTTVATLDGEPYAIGTEIVSEGDHVLRVEARDVAGNRAVAEVAFVVDRTAPSIAVEGIEDGAEVAPGAAATISVEDANLVTADATLDGVPYVSGTPIDAPGEHELVVRAVDCAGNVSEVRVRFVVAAPGEPAGDVTLFENADDPAWLEALGGSVDVRVFGDKDPDGLPTRVRLATVGELRLSFDGEGGVRAARSDGALTIVETVDGGYHVAWSDGVRTTGARVGAPGAASVGGDAPLRGAFHDRAGTRRWLGRAADTPPGGLLHDSVVALPSGSGFDAAAPNASGLAAATTCAGEVRLSTCGAPLDGAEVDVEVAAPGGEAYAVPAFPSGDGVYAYRVPCAVGPAVDATAFAAAASSGIAGACATWTAATAALDGASMCGDLAGRLALVEPGIATTAAERSCLDLWHGAVPACEAAFDAARAAATGFALVDRRADGERTLTAVVRHAAFGERSTGVVSDAAGPFGEIVVDVDDAGALVTALDTVWTAEGERFDITGRAACVAPGADVVYDSAICDFDGALGGCFPFVVSEPAGPDGTAEIGFGFTGSYGAEAAYVRFGPDGGPSRSSVVGF